jgi:anti-sigma B factor antagonist
MSQFAAVMIRIGASLTGEAVQVCWNSPRVVMEYMDFNIRRPASRYRGQRVFILEGPLTRSTTNEFEDIVRAEKAPVVIVDMSAVPYVDSDGLGAILKAHISCAKSGRQMALAAVPARLRTLLKVTGVEQMVATFPTVKEAQAKLRKKKKE